MKYLLIAVCLLTGCTVSVVPNQEFQKSVDDRLNAHAQVISAITAYIGKAQENGNLPKAEELEGK